MSEEVEAPGFTVTVRLPPEVGERFDELVKRAKTRNYKYGRADVAKELWGLVPTPVLTHEDKHFFVYGQDRMAVTEQSAPYGKDSLEEKLKAILKAGEPWRHIVTASIDAAYDTLSGGSRPKKRRGK